MSLDSVVAELHHQIRATPDHDAPRLVLADPTLPNLVSLTLDGMTPEDRDQVEAFARSPLGSRLVSLSVGMLVYDRLPMVWHGQIGHQTYRGDLTTL